MAKKLGKGLPRLAELVVGALFIFSSMGKADDASAFGELISKYGFEWLSILSPVIIIAEMLIGILLLLRIAPRLTAMASFVLVVIFTAAFAYAHLVNGVEDCGCFGNITTDMPVWATYLRNIILLLLSYYIISNNKHTAWSWTWTASTVLILVMTATTFWTGHTWKPSTFYANKIPSTHPLLGKEVSQTPLARYLKADKDSTYLVWVFSYNCGGCVNSIENIKQYQKGVADRFVALSVTDDADGRMHKLLNIPFKAQNVGNELVGFIKVIPTILYIKEGHIFYIIEESVPSVYQFKKLYLEMTDEEILQQQERMR